MDLIYLLAIGPKDKEKTANRSQHSKSRLEYTSQSILAEKSVILNETFISQ